MRPKIITFDPRAPNQHTRNEENFKKLCENLQNCLPSSSFFLFHDLKSKCAGTDEQPASASNEGAGEQDTPFTDNYDIATSHFKNIVDEHVENLTISDKEIAETERLTRGQSKSQLWFDKRK